MRTSYLDCPHNNIQQFTEICLDCGYNIYTTTEEYLADLEEQVKRKRKSRATTEQLRKIRKLESEL